MNSLVIHGVFSLFIQQISHLFVQLKWEELLNLLVSLKNETLSHWAYLQFQLKRIKKIRLTMTYPLSVGRNFDEILRVIDALQTTDKFGVATPADRKVGEQVIIPPSVTDEGVNNKFPQGFDKISSYLRYPDIK